MANLLYESEWGFKALTPANLTGENAIHIFPSQPNSDDLRYSKGSASLNSSVVTENRNGIQETTLIWVHSLEFVPGDGVAHYFHDNQGTGASQNRISLYIDAAGLLTFVLFDADSTQHLVSFDITGWTLGSTHQIAARYDLNNDQIELYTDGASRDATPDNALSSDTIGALGSTTQIGADVSQANQLNGSVSILMENRSWSDAEILADYDSGDGTPFVVSPNTILLGNYSDGVTTISYHPTGKGVSATVNNANDTTLTTDAGIQTAAFDGEEFRLGDATGFRVTVFADGDPSGDTTMLVDDGAGAVVTDIENVGRFATLDATTLFRRSDEAAFDILGNMTLSAWIRNSGDSLQPIAGKWNTGDLSYIFILDSSARMGLNISNAGTILEAKLSAVGAFTANVFNHLCYVYDNAANTVDFYVNGELFGSALFTSQTGAIFSGAARFAIGRNDRTGARFIGDMRDVQLFAAKATAAEVLSMATNPLIEGTANTAAPVGWWKLVDDDFSSGAVDSSTAGNSLDLTAEGNPAETQEAHLSRNLLVDGTMENGGIGAWTIVATPTTVDKETDTDSDSLSLHIVAAADNDGVSQTIPASNGDKFYLSLRHKVTAGSFEINVTNGGGGIETGIADAAWTELEKIIAATGNLTFQWLGEAAADDFNISKATLIKCVAGNVLDATTYYTLVNVDGGAVGAAWSGLGADAPETAAADLYIRDDTRPASTATKGSGFVSLQNPLYVG